MKPPATLFATFALFAVAATPSCVAQQPTKPAEKPFVLEAGELKLTELLDKSAAYLHWNILWSDQDLTAGSSGGQTFKLQQRTETDAAGCEELLANLLNQKSLALLPLDSARGMYEVIATQGPRSREVMNRAVSRTPEEVLARPGLRMPVLTVVALKHVNATIATNALRPFFASSGAPGASSLTIGNVGNNSAMLVCGFQDQVAAAVRLLQVVDVPAPEVAPALVERLERLEARLEKLEKQLGKGEKDDKTPEKR